MTEPLPPPQAGPQYERFLLTACLITFGCYAAAYMRLPVVPLYARGLGISTARIGLVSSAFFLVAGSLSVPLGLASDRFGRKPLASMGLGALALTSFALCASHRFEQLAGCYLLAGFGVAAFGPTMMSFVIDRSPPTHLGRSFGWYTTSLYAGMSLGPGLGGYLAQQFGPKTVFVTAGALTLVVLAAAQPLLPASPTAHREPAQGLASAAARRGVLGNGRYWGCILATLGGCFGLGMFVTFFPLQAQSLGLGVGAIGLVFAVQGLANALCRIPFGRLSDRVADRSRLGLLGLGAIALTLLAFAEARTTAHFIVAAGAFGVSMGLTFTSVGALTAEVVPASSRGLAMGIYNTAVFAAMMLNAATMGVVVERGGFAAGFGATALTTTILGAAFWFLTAKPGARSP